MLVGDTFPHLYRSGSVPCNYDSQVCTSREGGRNPKLWPEHVYVNLFCG